MRISCLAALIACAAVAGAAQERKFKKNYDAAGVEWKTWEDGQKEAIARNVPIHFTVHKDK